MTKEEIKKAAKVMLAYAQGESIQRQDPNGNWVDCVSPTFDWGSYDYRVKPKIPKADKIDHEVGEVFEVNGVKLQVVETSNTLSCDGCYFLDNEQNMCEFQKCLGGERKDGKDVVFQYAKQRRKKMDKEEEKMLSVVSAWLKGKQIGTMYIARDEGVYCDDYERKGQGKLHLFYDTPLLHKDPKTDTYKFDCARCIAEIPSYMYPDIEEGDCYEIGIIMNKCRYKEFKSPNNPIA